MNLRSINREQILTILYEMAMVIGGETSLHPLLTKTLQRLMYHTSFPVGVIFSEIRPVPSMPDKLAAYLQVSIGDFELAELVGSDVLAPAPLLLGETTLEENRPLLNGLPCRKEYYSAFLRMPIEGFGVILLLAPVMPHSELPVTRLFRPIISNFAKAIMLCQRNEAYTAELITQRNLAAQANQAKSIFLANMSHELRTPLTAVLGFAKLMSKDPATTETQREYLEIINRSGEHLLGLINDVLDMSKIEAGRIVVEPEPLDLHELVNDIAEMMHVRAEGKGLELSVHLDARFDRYLTADRAKLRQIFINLLANAIKFTPEGRVELEVTGERRGDQSWLVSEVRDTGVGIPRKDLDRIFEPFVQLEQKADAKGTGLGLAITRQFVELMGGKLTVESEVGRGSRFRFEIPAEPALEEQVRPAEVQPGRVAGVKLEQKGLPMLVADDKEETRLLLRRLLEPFGFDVREAADGAEAIEQFSASHPRFIWMDWRMPRVDGLTATRHIRALPGGDNVIIVALTASAFKEQSAEVIAAGCDDFLTKPFRDEALFRVIARHLDLPLIFEEPQAQGDGTAGREQALDGWMLRQLTPQQREALQQAAIECDSELLFAAIEGVRAAHPGLADGLMTLAKGYRYPEILSLLEGTAPPAHSYSEHL